MPEPICGASSPAPMFSSSHAQTLSRGIQLLETLASAQAAMTINELATAAGFHRSITYRLLRTLEDHHLVSRRSDGLYELGSGLSTLSRSVKHDLQTVAVPELSALANEFGTTALLVVWDHDSCINLAAVEPRNAPTALIQRAGTRHPFATGAPGLAIQSAVTREEWESIGASEPYRHEAVRAAQRGYALSRSEVIKGVGSVAAPVRIPPNLGYEFPASIALVYLESLFSEKDVEAKLAPEVVAAAQNIERALGGWDK